MKLSSYIKKLESLQQIHGGDIHIYLEGDEYIYNHMRNEHVFETFNPTVKKRCSKTFPHLAINKGRKTNPYTKKNRKR